MSCTENLKLFKTTEKNDSAIDRASQFICKAKVTSLSEADGRQLWHVSDTDNTAADVWADSVYRWQHNDKWLAKHSFMHRRKAAAKPMSEATRRANARKSSVRARIEHVFAH